MLYVKFHDGEENPQDFQQVDVDDSHLWKKYPHLLYVMEIPTLKQARFLQRI